MALYSVNSAVSVCILPALWHQNTAGTAAGGPHWSLQKMPGSALPLPSTASTLLPTCTPQTKTKTKTEGLESGRYQCFCFVSYSGGSRFILTEQCHRPFRTPGNCFQCIIYLIQTETTVWKVKVNTPVPNFLLNKHRPGFCYSSGSTSEGGLPNHNPSAPTWCTPPCSPP